MSVLLTRVALSCMYCLSLKGFALACHSINICGLITVNPHRTPAGWIPCLFGCCFPSLYMYRRQGGCSISIYGSLLSADGSPPDTEDFLKISHEIMQVSFTLRSRSSDYSVTALFNKREHKTNLGPSMTHIFNWCSFCMAPVSCTGTTPWLTGWCAISLCPVTNKNGVQSCKW